MHNKRSSPSTLPVFLPNLSFSFHREEKKEEGSLLEVSSHEPVKLCGNGSWRRRGWWTSVRRDAGREHEATKRRGNVSENVSARSCPTCWENDFRCPSIPSCDLVATMYVLSLVKWTNWGYQILRFFFSGEREEFLRFLIIIFIIEHGFSWFEQR